MDNDMHIAVRMSNTPSHLSQDERYMVIKGVPLGVVDTVEEAYRLIKESSDDRLLDKGTTEGASTLLAEGTDSHSVESSTR